MGQNERSFLGSAQEAFNYRIYLAAEEKAGDLQRLIGGAHRVERVTYK